jgi:hypothetical protein
MAIVASMIVLGVVLLLIAGACHVTNRHKEAVELTEFDQYNLPEREDFVLEDLDELDDLVFEGIVLYALNAEECEALCAFASNHVGARYGDIFRAFFRAQLEIE